MTNGFPSEQGGLLAAFSKRNGVGALLRVRGAAVVEGAFAVLGAFGAVAAVVLLGSSWLPPWGFGLVVGALASSTVLIFGACDSPFAQPRNVVLSYVLCPAVGTLVALLVPMSWLAAGLAVAVSVLLMRVTRSTHPPGGALALLPVLGDPGLRALGYGFILVPALAAMLLVGLSVLWYRATHRPYPVHWF